MTFLESNKKKSYLSWINVKFIYLINKNPIGLKRYKYKQTNIKTFKKK